MKRRGTWRCSCTSRRPGRATEVGGGEAFLPAFRAFEIVFRCLMTLITILYYNEFDCVINFYKIIIFFLFYFYFCFVFYIIFMLCPIYGRIGGDNLKKCRNIVLGHSVSHYLPLRVDWA